MAGDSSSSKPVVSTHKSFAQFVRSAADSNNNNTSNNYELQFAR